MLLEISQNPQENICARVCFCNKVAGPATLLKKRLWHRCFPVNFVEFLRTPFLQNTTGRLLLEQKNVLGEATRRVRVLGYEVSLAKENP